MSGPGPVDAFSRRSPTDEVPSCARSHASLSLSWNLGFDELRQQRERLLPAEIAGFGRDGAGYAFLHDIQLGPAERLLQGHHSPHLSGQIRIVKFVGMDNTFVRHQFEVLAAKRVASAGGEVRERHSERAADFRMQVV